METTIGPTNLPPLRRVEGEAGHQQQHVAGLVSAQREVQPEHERQEQEQERGFGEQHGG